MAKESSRILKVLQARLQSDARFSKQENQNGDVAFLNRLLRSPDLSGMLQMHDRLVAAQDLGVRAVCSDSQARCSKVLGRLAELPSHQRSKAEECRQLLMAPAFQAVLSAYDTLSKESTSELLRVPYRVEAAKTENGEACQRVTFMRNGNPLGCTIRTQLESDGQPRIYIARIMAGSMAEECSHVHTGQEIYAINDVVVRGSSTDAARTLMRQNPKAVTLTLVASGAAESEAGVQQERAYVRALYNYNPQTDEWAPSADNGLAFERGDILEIVRQDDELWWQCKHLSHGDRVGMIPSSTLQSRRPKSLQAAAGIPTSRSLRAGVAGSRQPQGARQEVFYELVARANPANKTLYPVALIGPPRVGCNSLKQELLNQYPDLYADCIPHTTRSPKPDEVPGTTYHFTTKAQMKTEMDQGRFIEYGELQGDLYGTSVSAIQHVTRAGKTCILDVSADTVPRVRNRQLQALVVFVKPPNLIELRQTRGNSLSSSLFTTMLSEGDRMDRQWGHMVDHVVVNRDIKQAAEELHAFIVQAQKEARWVPLSWTAESTS